MAITDFASLKTALTDHMARSDLATVADELVSFATDYFNYGGDPLTDPPLRCRDMEEVASLTPASGVCALPADYLQYRRVVEEMATRKPLSYIAPSSAEIMYPSRYAGTARHFTIIGGDLYVFPLATNDIELTYYQKIPHLSDANTTNWLLTKHPQIYLRACMVMACVYIKDMQQAEANRALLRPLVSGLSGSDMMSQYANAGLTIAGYVA